MEDAPVEEGAYDAAVSCHVIEHLHNPIPLLAKAFQALRPGGRMVLVTPNPEGRTAARFGFHWYWLDPPRHLVMLTAESLAMLARKAGFRDVEVRSGVRDAHAQYYASRSIMRSGRFAHGSLPGLPGRLRAQCHQFTTAVLRRLNKAEGDELILWARR